jgi:hypothetical protein
MAMNPDGKSLLETANTMYRDGRFNEAEAAYLQIHERSAAALTLDFTAMNLILHP